MISQSWLILTKYVILFCFSILKEDRASSSILLNEAMFLLLLFSGMLPSHCLHTSMLVSTGFTYGLLCNLKSGWISFSVHSSGIVLSIKLSPKLWLTDFFQMEALQVQVFLLFFNGCFVLKLLQNGGAEWMDPYSSRREYWEFIDYNFSSYEILFNYWLLVTIIEF